jgi:LmbE family N-acetylglucosaminyl deacetylase
LAVFAHPDDETYRPGGTLALLAQQGVRVQVLTATRGEAGSCGDPPLCRADELAVVRERELCCACAALGIEPPRLLDHHDGHVSETDQETIVVEILTVVRQTRPQVILTYGLDGISGHPDHVAIGQCAAEAFRRTDDVAGLYAMAVPRSLAQTLGMTQIRAVPDEAITLTVDVSACWDLKLAAIRCHRTQQGSSPILAASSKRQRLFLGREYYRRVAWRGELDLLTQWEAQFNDQRH